MNLLLIVVVVLAVLFFLRAGLVPSLNFLIWVGVVLLILAVLAPIARHGPLLPPPVSA
ncbi:hypothetical protein [Arthrobacter sp. U41]|uniref:hypothetical protein n=1 Tax=Arthrobacter sp. U41 TaxID=1849032 RepID=UPI0018D2884A|nr:hypothetical protein [Arthrobacter sp. U41]